MANETNRANEGWEWGAQVRRTIAWDADLEQQIAQFAQQSKTTANELIRKFVEDGLRQSKMRSGVSAGV